MIKAAVAKDFIMIQPGVINLWLRKNSLLTTKLSKLLFFRRNNIPIIFAPTSIAVAISSEENFDFCIGNTDAL
jgi:hypothetical protein